MDTSKPPGPLVLRREPLPLDAQEAVIQFTARTGRPLDACEALGYSPRSYHKTVELDAEFAACIEAAIARHVERLEEAADKRAVEGWEEEVYQGGVLAGTVRKYSDRLLEVRLRALAPRRYRDNVSVDARVAGVLVVPQSAGDPAAWSAAFGGTALAKEDCSREEDRSS